VVARVRHIFDLDADIATIDAHLSKNGLRDSVEHLGGVRVPGAFDGFELTVRAVLGQQVTVKGATTLMSRLTVAFGSEAESGDPMLTHLSPTAERLAASSVSEIRSIGLPGARAATLLALGESVASGKLAIEAPRRDPTELARQLTDLPGVGPWTANYVAMRAAHWSDAFPATDVALRRATGKPANELSHMAEQWRPWRAYAAMRLWMSGAPTPRSTT
jgi:AraC family transcriptional regulator, regulatory protein of adaptative response / DNA-3-methyladenine glycosylase II